MRTLYEALDLPRDADEQQIKAAYRTLARRFHPDVNAGDAACTERLAEINHAYATLGNPQARAAYHRDLARRRTEIRRRYVAFAATSVVTFVVTASLVSFVVRRHLEAAPGTGLQVSPAKGSPAALAQSRMPGSAPSTPQGGADLASSSQARAPASWTTYRDARFDFALRYPAGIFTFDAARSDANVRTYVSRDRRAVLRIIAAQNTAGVTLASLRSTLIKQRYAGASFEQAPRRQLWFALSGTRGDEVFRERITFSCDGKSMHGWQLLYPSSQRASYDALAKLILRNYPHGNGPGAGCGDARTRAPAKRQARRKRD